MDVQDYRHRLTVVDSMGSHSTTPIARMENGALRFCMALGQYDERGIIRKRADLL